MREPGRGVHATSAPCRGPGSNWRHMVLQVMSAAIREIAPKRKRTVAKGPSMHAAVDATGKVSAVNKRIGKDRAKVIVDGLPRARPASSRSSLRPRLRAGGRSLDQ